MVSMKGINHRVVQKGKKIIEVAYTIRLDRKTLLRISLKMNSNKNKIVYLHKLILYT